MSRPRKARRPHRVHEVTAKMLDAIRVPPIVLGVSLTGDGGDRGGEHGDELVSLHFESQQHLVERLSALLTVERGWGRTEQWELFQKVRIP